MLIPDMPNVPPQYAQVMLVQAAPAQTNSPIDQVSFDRTIGVCELVENPLRYTSINGIGPIGDAQFYFESIEHRQISIAGVVTVLQNPRHGTLEPRSDAPGGYLYLPEVDYFGPDRATFQVEVDGKKIKVEYFFKVLQGVADDYTEEQYKNLCPNGNYWKISTTLNPDGTNTLTSVEYQSGIIDAGATTTDTASLASTLSASILSTLSVDPSLVTFNLADLAGGAVGQAVGNTITLDDNAADHNWYIDTTPWDNSEYLPTSNPNEWVAKAGSAAAGKMDMLSVLLHEYGHALGIDHSAANHDYMATTLPPGVRRMPSATEMALMQQLVAQAKGDTFGVQRQDAAFASDGSVVPLPSDNSPIPLPIPLGAGFGMAFIGRMRRSSYGGTSIDTVGAQFIAPNPQYAVAANATFANLATPAGWNTQGSVDINPSTGSGRTDSVTLNEISTSQTRLSQVFMLNEQDRYLSFTLSGTALDDLNGAPDDAFEVALLDANTGTNLLGGIGLSHSDAFLNIQGDGTEHTAAGVTRTDNADGSRTYRVDLSAVAKNNAVNLSFDLLGFGQDNPVLSGVEGSHVTLSDIRVSGLPQSSSPVGRVSPTGVTRHDRRDGCRVTQR